MRARLTVLALILWAGLAGAAELPDQLPGWVIHRTPYAYGALVARVEEAIARSPLAEVNRASATVGARRLGQEIPGNPW